MLDLFLYLSVFKTMIFCSSFESDQYFILLLIHEFKIFSEFEILIIIEAQTDSNLASRSLLKLAHESVST